MMVLTKKLVKVCEGSLQELFPGLTIELTALPTEAALNFGRESDYDLFLIYWTPDYQDPYFYPNDFITRAMIAIIRTCL